MKEFVTRVTRISVLPKGEPIFSEHCTNVSITDEAGGEYLEIKQQANIEVDDQTILITPEEWPAIKSAIETMLGEIETWGKADE